jgi:hypothetical protein
MPDRRNRLPAGTRAASQRAVQKVYENEQKLAELRGRQELTRRVREVLTAETRTVEIDGATVDVVPVEAIERALA